MVKIIQSRATDIKNHRMGINDLSSIESESDISEFVL